MSKESDALIAEVEAFLASERRRIEQQRIFDAGMLLILLAMRGVTPSTPEFTLRPGDADAPRLSRYLLDPGLDTNLATVRIEADQEGRPLLILRPNWERIAGLFGRSVQQLDSLMTRRLPGVINRHRATIRFLLQLDKYQWP